MEFDFKTVPYKHQVKEFEFHRNAKARALIWQMRTGKTKAMIDLACYLWKSCEIDAVLVVAPNNVHLNWERRELPKHQWSSVSYSALVWEATKADERYDRKFAAFCKEQRKLRWFMVNAEALGNLKGRKYIAKFLKTTWRVLLITDEVHEFRWATSKRSEALRGIANRMAYKRILSANPIDNSPLHSFAEFEILQPGALGFAKYSDFKARYAIEEEVYVPGGYSKSGVKRRPRKMPAVVGYQNQEELQASIAKWSSLVLRDEVDELPDLIRDQVDFELLPIQKRLHNELVTGVLARLDNGELIKPEEGGVLAIRLQQIASGYAVNDEGQIVDLMEDKDNPRMQALKSVVNEVPGKFIVWCRFREDVKRVTRFLNANKMKAVHYCGYTTKRQRIDHEEMFRHDPKCVALVGQYQAGGQGLDFSSAGDIIWYSHTQDLLRRRQADERATVMGGRKIGLTDLVAIGSNDAKMLAELVNREERADFLTGVGLRRYFEIIK